MSGWICSYRAIWEHPIFKGNAERVGVWDWMLKTAAWKRVRFSAGADLIEIERGQLCVSQAQVSQETGMTRQRFRTFLKALEREGAVLTRPATKSTKGRTLITICKYDKYQAQQPEANQESTKEQPTKEQGNNIPVGAGKPADPVKVLFDSGIQLLTAAGKNESHARSILGKWKAAHGTEAVIAALGRAQREGAIEPISFIEGCFKFQAKKERPEPGDRRTLPDGRNQYYANHYDGWMNEIC